MPSPPSSSLPLDPHWLSTDSYVSSLLHFATSNLLFRTLCGGIHILDFLTRRPDLYATVLPAEWRDWFNLVDVEDVLFLLLRADVRDVERWCLPEDGERGRERWRLRDREDGNGEGEVEVPCPPVSLCEYVLTVRRHCLRREYESRAGGGGEEKELPRHIAVGMKPKKAHEVVEFAAFVDRLSKDVVAGEGDHSGEQPAIVDFGSGQNYLGRTLASPPYERHVIAIERRHHNVDGARDKDVLARLTAKEKVMRNKKEFKKRIAEGTASLKWQHKAVVDLPGPKHESPIAVPQRHTVKSETGKGSMTYIEASIEDGNLETILYPLPPPSETSADSDSATSSTTPSDPTTAQNHPRQKPPLIVISLHSCGNLLHHGLRSLLVNPTVTAVALIGCCYNLMTERLGSPRYKLPQLRPNHPRLAATSSACDPAGFPMSKTLETYESATGERGLRLNITARMMGVQAPGNWGKEDSEMFFRRHFYRALLQRILLDRGAVRNCVDAEGNEVVGGGLNVGGIGTDGNSVSGKDSAGTPLIVGSLKKACFASFGAYVRGALEKLQADAVDGTSIKEKTAGLTDEDIAKYEADWGYAKKNLAVIWSLMAFSAGVVESVIVIDRWLFLKEQECVGRCWVEPVFDYKLSPRNLVVVGIKKKDYIR